MSGFDLMVNCAKRLVQLKFKRYVALVVLARKIQLIGAKIRKKSLERQRRLERIAA